MACFDVYMKHQGQAVSRAQFERNLFEKENNPAFLADIRPLLAVGISHDAKKALALVREDLISRLAGEPWQGTSPDADTITRGQRRGKERRS